MREEFRPLMSQNVRGIAGFPAHLTFGRSCAARATLIARARSLHASLVTLAARLGPAPVLRLAAYGHGSERRCGARIFLSAANRAGRSPQPGNGRPCAAADRPGFQS
jgi:hypothetical protein